MRGVITSRHWRQIERTFPGLHLFYSHLPRKPRTFLALLELYRMYQVFTGRSGNMLGNQTCSAGGLGPS